MKSSLLTISVFTISLMAALSANAALILQFDSETTTNITTGVNNVASSQLTEIFNDSAFVTSFSPTTFTDGATTSRTHQTQNTAVSATPNGLDLAFNFGGNTTLTGAPTATSPYVGVNFVAAQDFTLTEFSLNADPNNQNGTNFAARDNTLFVSVGGGAFMQFGNAINRTGNGLNTNTFTDSVFVQSGQTVEFRAAFSDKTLASANNLQSFTRIGDIQIDGIIPEPSSIILFGFASISLFLSRKKRF